MEESIWFTTRSALFRPGDAAWNEIAAYGEPLRRFLTRRYPWIKEADRDDLVQDVLIEMKAALAPRHDRSRGKFRALLQTVVKRRVADRLRRKRAEPFDEVLTETLAAPQEAEVEALDLETQLLAAVAACRDRFTQGKERDPDVVYALADRIVHGRTSAEIAKRGKASADRIARLLEKGRDAIFRHFLASELEIPHEDQRVDTALATFKESLRRPGATADLIEKVRDRELRRNLEELVPRFRAALRFFQGDETARGVELRRGLAFIFEGTLR